MKPNEMTLSEFLAFNGNGGAKGLEEYKRLLTKYHWLNSRIFGRHMAMYDAKDSMSVFSEEEHDDPQYLKYLHEYQQSSDKAQKYQNQLSDIEEQLLRYMKQ